jgi:hypothetical protein
MFLLKVVQVLGESRIPYAVVGGYAVALHGAVRGTVDLDLVLGHSEEIFRRAEKALNSMGLFSRLPVRASEVFRFRDEYIRNRGLTAWTFVNPEKPSEIVDLILTHDLAGMKTRRMKVQGRTVRVASIDDLIRMKAGTGRPQDDEDIRALRSLK